MSGGRSGRTAATGVRYQRLGVTTASRDKRRYHSTYHNRRPRQVRLMSTGASAVRPARSEHDNGGSAKAQETADQIGHARRCALYQSKPYERADDVNPTVSCERPSSKGRIDACQNDREKRQAQNTRDEPRVLPRLNPEEGGVKGHC